MNKRLQAIGLAVFVLLAAAAILGASARAATVQAPVNMPREVKIGLLLADLTEVHDAERAFAADVVLVASWKDASLATGDDIRTLDLDEVWHPTLMLYNRRSVSESMPKEVIVRPDGTVTYLQRYTGLFSAAMDLREFPKDRQEFFVWVVSLARFGPSVTLVPEESMAALRAPELSIRDWRIGDLVLSKEPLQISRDSPVNPGIKLTIPASRRVTYYTIQVLIPLMAIVMMAYPVFWIAPSVVPTRVGVVVTTMLTLIAYRFMLANHVPRLSYLTRLDWFLLGATMLVILTLFTMAATSFLMSREREDIVNRIDHAGRVLYPAVFAVFTASDSIIGRYFFQCSTPPLASPSSFRALPLKLITCGKRSEPG